MTDDKLPDEVGNEKAESMEFDWVRKDLNVGAPRPQMPGAGSYGPPPAPPMAGRGGHLLMPGAIISLIVFAILIVVVGAILIWMF